MGVEARVVLVPLTRALEDMSLNGRWKQTRKRSADEGLAIPGKREHLCRTGDGGA
jgi:hypothetical protein